MEVSSYQATGATGGPAGEYTNRMRVADTASRLTISVNEDLGSGLKAGVYCETGMNVDTASAYGQADTANPNTTTLCSREGRAFIGNDLGEIRLGRQNVWWTQGDLNEVGSNLLGADVLTNFINGHTRGNAGVGIYTVRGENMVKLLAGPQFGAFANSEVYWGYMGASGNAVATGPSGEAADPNTDRNSKYNGFKLNYSQAQWFGMVDYQNSTQGTSSTFAGTAGAGTVAVPVNMNRSAYKLGAGYRYAEGSKVALQYWKKEASAYDGTGQTYKDSGYGVTLNHALSGTYTLVAQYGRAKDVTNGSVTMSDTGARGYTLGGLMRLSKRTHLYSALHKINNGTNAGYDMIGGSYTSAPTAQANTAFNGNSVRALSLGMVHNF